MILKKVHSCQSPFFNKIAFLLLFLGCQSLFSQGYKIPEKPKFQTSVYDYINLLSESQKNSLENKLIKYSDTTSTQIVVAIIASTEGENIGYLAANWGEEWGIGQAKEDNGVLVLLAKNDRNITISSGKGVEHLLTDFASKRIIEREIIPEFKSGDFYAGLDKGADAIFQTLNGEYEGTRETESNSNFGFIIFIIIIIIFFLLLSRGNKNNKGGRNFRKRGLANTILETIILSNAGRGGFGSGGFGSGSSSGGFGGGGFGGGFGGGSFGGGGASGSW